MNENQIVTDEISFKELIHRIREYIIAFIKDWKIYVLILIPSLAYFLYTHYTYKINYSAQTKFVVEGGNSLGSGIGGLLGQIGLRGGGSGKFNNFKILEVAKSKKILGGIIFEKYKGDFIANHLLKQYQLNEKWGKSKPEFLNFKFSHSDVSKFTKTESAAYGGLIGLVTGGAKVKDPILAVNYNEDTGIYSIYSNAREEELTLKLAELNYSRLRYFFENELVDAQVKTTAILKYKSDSLHLLIRKKTAQIANIQDQTYGLIKATPTVNRAALEKEILALGAAQAEFIKSYEMADIGLRDIRAAFIKLDESIGPLEPVESSLIFSLIKAFGIAGLVSFLISALRKLYKES